MDKQEFLWKESRAKLLPREVPSSSPFSASVTFVLNRPREPNFHAINSVLKVEDTQKKPKFLSVIRLLF